MAKSKNIFDSPVQERTPYSGESRIDPRLIYGFPNLASGEPPVIENHDQFPNPRTSPMDPDLIENIRESGDYHDPVKLYEYDDEDYGLILIPVEGKTRLTATAVEWAENPNTTKFAQVPYVLVTGTPEEIRVKMAVYNLDEERRPISKLEAAQHLNMLRNRFSMDPAKIEEYLGMTKRHVTRYLNDMERILQNPDVKELVEKGDLSVTSATDIVNKTKDKTKQTEVAKTVAAAGKQAVQTAKASGAGKKEQAKAQAEGEKTARQAGGIKGKSRTTATFPDTIQEYGSRWLLLKSTHPMSPAYLQIEGVDFTNEKELLAFLQQTENAQSYRELKFFTKSNGMSDFEFMQWFEGQCKEMGIAFDDQSEKFPTTFGGKAKGEAVKDWKPEDESSSTPDTKTEAPKEEAPKTTTKPKGGASTTTGKKTEEAPKGGAAETKGGKGVTNAPKTPAAAKEPAKEPAKTEAPKGDAKGGAKPTSGGGTGKRNPGGK